MNSTSRVRTCVIVLLAGCLLAAYGSVPSNFTDATWQHGGSDGEIFVTIRDGVGPGFSMDAYRDRLTEPEVWNLVNYLRTLGR